MRPSRPVAGIFDGSNCFSSTMRRTEGASLPLSFAAAAGAATAADLAAAGAGAGAAFAGAAAAAPSSSTASTWPLVTEVPATMRNSLSTPVTGAGTSSTTLSVSRSARFSSRVTAWPTCLCQVTSVASATDSGSWGTLISMDMLLPLARRGGCSRHGCRHEALGLARPVFFVGGAQCRFDEPALFRFVHLADAGRRCSRRSTACVQQFPLAHERREPMTDLVPGALVLRLFLAPHDFACVRVLREHRFHLRHRKWIELLDTHERDFRVGGRTTR